MSTHISILPHGKKFLLNVYEQHDENFITKDGQRRKDYIDSSSVQKEVCNTRKEAEEKSLSADKAGKSALTSKPSGSAGRGKKGKE